MTWQKPWPPYFEKKCLGTSCRQVLPNSFAESSAGLLSGIPATAYTTSRTCASSSGRRKWIRPLTAIPARIGAAIRRRYSWAGLQPLFWSEVAVGALVSRGSPDVRAPGVVRTVISTLPGPQPELSRYWPDLAINPDGDTAVYRTKDGLYLRPLDRLEGSLLPQTGRARNPIFSLDGERLAFVDQNMALKRVSVRGGPASLLRELSTFSSGLAWTDQGLVVAADLDGRPGNELNLVSGEGVDVEPLLQPGAEDRSLVWPSMLPGATSVLFTIAPAGLIGLDHCRIEVLDLESRQRKPLIEGGGGAVYSSSGHLIYATTGEIRAVAFDLDRLETRGDPVTVVQSVATKPTGPNFSISNNGSLLYMSGDAVGAKTSTLVWVDRGGAVESIEEAPQHYLYPSLSPNGEKLAVSLASDTRDIWVWDLVRKTSTRLTSHPAEDVYAVWTADSRHIYFSSARTGGTYQIFTVAADGTSPPTQAHEGERSIYPRALSGDGETLLFRLGPAFDHDLGVLELASGKMRMILADPDYDERNIGISPDGRWIAYESDETGRFEVYVRSFPDIEERRWRISEDGGTWPAWSPDGTELFFRSGDRLMAVPVSNMPHIEPGVPKALFSWNFPVSYGRSYDVSADGSRFVMVKSGTGQHPRVVLVENFGELLRRLVPTS